MNIKVIYYLSKSKILLLFAVKFYFMLNYNLRYYQSSQYVLVSLTSTLFKSRVRVQLGRGSINDYPFEKLTIENETGAFFNKRTICSFDEAEQFLRSVIANLKKGRSIFDFIDDFLQNERRRINSKTKTGISTSRLKTLSNSVNKFKEFMSKNNHPPRPEYVDDALMTNYFDWLVRKHGSRNYCVKIFSATKRYLKYVEKKGIRLNQSYADISYTETYDNNWVEDDDRALSIADLKKLIVMKLKFEEGNIALPIYKKCERLDKIQAKQSDTKLKNLKLSLDCFLFMTATGQYHADLSKGLTIKRNNKGEQFINYRRKKNEMGCTSIPIFDNEIFITQQLINQYKIKSGSNFPYPLTLASLEKHLKVISEFAELGFTIKPKYARKTFATILYYDFEIKISLIMKLLGHSSEQMTRRYLRINDDDVVSEILLKVR